MLKKNLDFILKKNEITLTIFAKKMDLSYAKAGTYVRGESKMSIDTLLLLSKKFNVSCDDLLKTDLSKKENDYVTGLYGVKKEVTLLVDSQKNEKVNEEKENYQLQQNFKNKYMQALEEIRELQNERAALLKENSRLKKPNITNY